MPDARFAALQYVSAALDAYKVRRDALVHTLSAFIDTLTTEAADDDQLEVLIRNLPFDILGLPLPCDIVEDAIAHYCTGAFAQTPKPF